MRPPRFSMSAIVIAGGTRLTMCSGVTTLVTGFPRGAKMDSNRITMVMKARKTEDLFWRLRAVSSPR
jgi:hypothetical protein